MHEFHGNFQNQNCKVYLTGCVLGLMNRTVRQIGHLLPEMETLFLDMKNNAVNIITLSVTMVHRLMKTRTTK